ncbi:MAG: 4-hydroxy-3-methylbut-2-enyl diphosphate reductase, partial [Betaproteobacteria bacterium]|nr:4-hydroxy-3-methylbut-2-enyl diphosphate reductase [Betaproteobacteria bacterium]
QNRQDAIKQILPSTDILFVVGSKNSSNSNRLKELGEKKGIPSILIDDMSDFNPAWLDDKKNIAITAGASAPEVLIKQLTKLIQSHSNAIINEIDGPKENIVFKLPVI